MKSHRPAYKLISGIVLFALSSMFMCYVSDMAKLNAEHYLRDVLFSFLPTSLAAILTSLIGAFVYCTVLVYFLKGCIRIITFNHEEFKA